MFNSLWLWVCYWHGLSILHSVPSPLLLSPCQEFETFYSIWKSKKTNLSTKINSAKALPSFHNLLSPGLQAQLVLMSASVTNENWNVIQTVLFVACPYYHGVFVIINCHTVYFQWIRKISYSPLKGFTIVFSCKHGLRRKNWWNSMLYSFKKLLLIHQ